MRTADKLNEVFENSLSDRFVNLIGWAPVKMHLFD